MVRKEKQSDSIKSELNLAQALSEAAANLQRAVYSEETIERVFHQQIDLLGLRGGILLLDDSKERMQVLSAAEGRFQKILKRFEKALGITAKGFSFDVANVDVYREVVENAEVVFVPDASIVIEQMLPELARPIAGRISKAFGDYPGIYAPLMSQGQIIGAINIVGEELTEDGIASVRAFAGHVAAAMDNARLYSELRESEAHFRSLIEQSPVSIIMYHPDGYPIYGNRAAVKLWNLQANMLEDLYQSYNIFEDQQLIEMGLLPYIERGFAGEYVEMPPVLYEVPDANSHGNASKRWIKGTIYPVKDQSGSILEIVLMQEDITESVLAEEALRENEARYRQIFENSAVSLWEEDFTEVIAEMDALLEQGVDDLRAYLNEHPEFLVQAAQKIKILDINETTVEMYQASSKEELLGSLDKISLDDTGEILKEELLAIAEGKTFFGGETVNRTLQGEKKDILLTMAIPPERERLDNVLVSVMDITRRVQAEDRLKRQLNELSVLNQVAKAGIDATHEDELIDRITQIIGEVLFPHNFGVLLIDESTKEIYPHPSYRGVPDHARELRFLTGPGSIVGVVCASGVAKLIPDTEKEPDYFCAVEETRSELAVPLKIAGRVVGVINSESDQLDFFSEDDLRLMTTVASQLSTAIERIRNDVAEWEQRQFNIALRTCMTAINSTLVLEEIFDQIMDAVQLVVPYETANIMEIRGGFAKVMRHRGFDDRGLRDLVETTSFPLTDYPIIDHLVKAQQVIYIPNTRESDTWVYTPGEEWIHSYLGAPIRLEGRVIGVINLNHSQTGFYSGDLGERLLAFSDQVAIAINNANLYQDAIDSSDRKMALYAASQEMIQARHDPIAIYESIHDAVERIMRADAFIISLAQNGDADIRLAYAFEKGKRIPETFIPAHTGLSGYVIDNGASIYIENIDTYRGEFDVQKIGDSEYIQSLIAIPLNVSDRTLGMLSAQSSVPNAYSDDDLYMLEMLGAHAAAILENVDLYQSAVEDAHRWAALQNVSQKVVAASQDLVSAYQALHTATRSMMPTDAFAIALLDEDLNEIELVYAYDGDERSPVVRVPHNSGLSGYLIENDRSILIPDLEVHEFDFEINRFGSAAHVRSVLAVPIRVKDKILGVLSAQSYQVNDYSTEDQFNLELMASLAANVLDNAKLYDQAQRRLDELEAISLISAALREAATVDEMLPILLEQASQVTRAEFGAIHLEDSVSGDLVAKEWNPPRPDLVGLRHRLGEGVTGHVALTREMYLTQDLLNDPIAQIHPEEAKFFENVATNLTLPLLATDDLVGVINVGLPKGRSFRDEEIDLLTSIAHIAANAIRRATLYEKTQLSLLRLSGLREIDQAISASLDLNFTLRVLIDQVIGQLKVDATDVLLYNPHTLSLEYSAGSGFKGTTITHSQVRIDQGFAGQAARERKLVSIPSIAENSSDFPRKKALLREGFVSYFGVPLSAKGKIVGILEIFHRKRLIPDREWIDFLETLAGQVAIAINNARLYQDLQLANLNISLAYDRTLEGWAHALELRDQETEGHSRRVTDMTIRLARQLGIKDEELVHVRRGVLLHDIGKMGVPDRILLKEGPLSDDEWEIMRLHPIYAFEMLSQIDYLIPSLDIPYCHHEKWDGSGYPRGLREHQIPLSARIFAVVDVWDALRSERPYRGAWEDEKVAEYIKEQSGSHFDPQIVEIFLRNWQPNGQ